MGFCFELELLVVSRPILFSYLGHHAALEESEVLDPKLRAGAVILQEGRLAQRKGSVLP